MTKIAKQIQPYPTAKSKSTNSSVFTSASLFPPTPPYQEWDCVNGSCIPVSPPGQFTYGPECELQCGDPPILCYDIGDVGPGGGIIFAIPGFPSYVPAEEYWEITSVDLCAIDEPGDYDGIGSGANTVTICSNTQDGGSEWGIFGVPGFTTLANNQWGAGQSTTDSIYNLDTSLYSSDPVINPGGDAACGMFAPCSPKNPTRSIAARLAKDYNGGGFTDWFLPSWIELSTAMWNVGPLMQMMAMFTNPLGPNHGNFAMTGNNGQKVYYWSSSAGTPSVPGWFLQGADASAFVVSTTSMPFQAHYSSRCYTRRVRAVRKFICADPVPVECSGRSCVDYNFKDGMCMVMSGFGIAGFIGHAALNAYTSYNVQWWGVSGAGTVYNDTIGETVLAMMVPSRDVMGNDITEAMWNDDSLGYTITIWTEDYVYLGKWRYDTFLHNNSLTGVSTLNNHNTNMLLDSNRMLLTNVTHLDGPNAIVSFELPGSLTGAYFKIEAAWNSTIAAPFENAMNNTPWGNAEFPADTFLDNSPYGCEAGANITGGGNIQGDCIPTFGTHTHYDLAGNVIYIFPDGHTCDSGCGAAIVDPNTGSQSSVAPNPGNHKYKIINSKQLMEGVFEVDTVPKTGNSKEELRKLRKKRR